MIEIKNVTKIYHAKKKSQHKALDNVNLTLQDNGLVFVIGKSGSGKSTLLNLIGGLDSVTEGNIVVDGNNITNYTDKQLSNYRSSHIGFIFQDYHLLEEMTVQENIQLSLKLIGQEDNGQVATALERVGLAGYENRYPDELSGGEQQRVAIARAIVKRPRLILADEPTGNLDNVTATSIIHLLKELAQDCLIIIVSHNTIDTYTYADRIVQLSAGKVISDQSRNANFSTEILFQQDQLVYPCDKVLSDTDVGAINQHLQNNQLQKVVLVKDKYVQTEQPSTTNARTVAIPNNKPTRKSVGQLCKTFLQSKKLRIALYSFIVAVIIVVLALAETIMAFDSGKVIAREMLKENQTSLFVSKTNDLPNPIREGEKYYEMLDPSHVDLFKQEFSKSKVYPVYNSSVPITLYQNANGVQGVYMTKGTFRETFGTMLVDEQFFVDKLGTLEFEKVLPEDKIHPLGVYITDFVADQIVKYSTRYRNQTYDKILGQYTYSNTLMQPTYINGIIKTGYKAKHEKFLDELYRSTSKEAA
ncbi:MAG: ABC transporter ATP-binding protein, partial [Clostridia bacterium]|nr:ABC transporter ATP-binding protein [Clostridia bacterium]